MVTLMGDRFDHVRELINRHINKCQNYQRLEELYQKKWMESTIHDPDKDELFWKYAFYTHRVLDEKVIIRALERTLIEDLSEEYGA